MWFLAPTSNSSSVSNREWQGESHRHCLCVFYSVRLRVCVAWTPSGLGEAGAVRMVLRRSLPRKPVSHKYSFAGPPQWLAPERVFKINRSVYRLGSHSPTIFNILLGMVTQWEASPEGLNTGAYEGYFHTVASSREPFEAGREDYNSISQMRKLEHWEAKSFAWGHTAKEGRGGEHRGVELSVVAEPRRFTVAFCCFVRWRVGSAKAKRGIFSSENPTKHEYTKVTCLSLWGKK